MRGSSRNSLAPLSQCRTRDCATSVIRRRARHTCHTAASFKVRAGPAVMFGICCKNSLTIQDVAAPAGSSLLWNVTKIFFATDPNLAESKIMERDRWEKIEQLYHAALELEPNARNAFLDEVCAGDEALRREVAGLLAFDIPSDNFIQSPAIEIAARAMAAEPH